MESLAVGIGYVSVLMPVFLIWVIFSYNTKSEKAKYDAMVDISKRLDNQSDISDLLEIIQDQQT